MWFSQVRRQQLVRCLLGISVALGVAVLPSMAAPPLEQVKKLSPGANKEISGLIKSRQHADLFWSLNDSDNPPRIYPLHADGTLYLSPDRKLTSLNVDNTGVLIQAARNVDWEDIALLGNDTLVIADVGNNANARQDLTLYLVKEPDPLAETAQPVRVLHVAFPEQKKYPAPKSDFNYDCEAVWATEHAIYLATKHRSNKNTRVYMLDLKTLEAAKTETSAATIEPATSESKSGSSQADAGPPIALKRLEEFAIGGQVTAADYDPLNKRLVLCTYQRLWLFDVQDPLQPLANPVSTRAFDAIQVESLCFDSPDSLLLADEFTAMLYRVKLTEFEAQ